MIRNQLAFLKEMGYRWYSRLSYYTRIRREIQARSQANRERIMNQQPQEFINKLTIQGFENETCKARWGEISDREFGGDSISTLTYQPGFMTLHGKIDTSDMNRLECRPFIGMIQKLPFSFRIGMFNMLRVEIQGDGHPITCQLQIPFYHQIAPIQCKATILTSYSLGKEWTTYELPFRNFYVAPDEFSGFSTLKDRAPTSMPKMLLHHSVSIQDVQIDKVSFILQSSVPIQREVRVRSVQLVQSVRGELRYAFPEANVDTSMMVQKTYLKPYFYIVDEKAEVDDFLKAYDIGPYQYSYENGYTKKNTPNLIKGIHE